MNKVECKYVGKYGSILCKTITFLECKIKFRLNDKAKTKRIVKVKRY